MTRPDHPYYMLDHFINLSTPPTSHHAHEGAVASLSEREKRALAAEKRMAHQLPTDSAIQRCVSVILFSCVVHLMITSEKGVNYSTTGECHWCFSSLRAGVCSWCGMSLGGVVPFERLQYKYCTMNCLKEHRTQLNKK